VIAETDERIRAWASEAGGGTQAWLDAPKASEQREGVGVYLLELAEAPPPRGATPAPLQLQLRYLVTAWAPTPEAEHRLLAALVFAAMRRPDLEVALRPPDASVWLGFGIPPRPAFLLHVPVRVEREVARAPRVRVAETRFVASGRVDGVLVGPGDVPIAGASVELAALGLSATTAWNGTFALARIPREAGALRLRVTARGEARDVDVNVPAAGERLIVRMTIGEA
jgi:hypothetical protein